MTKINIKVEGLEKLRTAMHQFPDKAKRHLEAAGQEAAEDILNTEGLRRYPAASGRTDYPYYIRGKGTQWSPTHNSYTSERLGTQFYVQSEGYKTIVGNRASYARYVVGEGQAQHMAPRGWRKLIDVAREKVPDITKIYQDWVNRLIRELEL